MAVEMAKAWAAATESPVPAKQTAKLLSVIAAAASPASAAIVSESRVPWLGACFHASFNLFATSPASVSWVCWSLTCKSLCRKTSASLKQRRPSAVWLE